MVDVTKDKPEDFVISTGIQYSVKILLMRLQEI